MSSSSFERKKGRDVHKFNREVRRDNNDMHRDRSQRERDREYRNNFEDNRERKSHFEEVKVKKESSPEWGKSTAKTESKPKPQDKDKPNFEPSGKLTEDTNTVNGVVIKYSEPADARKPKRRWRLYPFKGEKALPTLYVHRQSAYLMGRDRKIADIPLDHPSCSKQHAVLQYRLVSFQKEGGGEGRRIRPYLIDLESANGTFVNNVKLEPRRYHELLERDVLRFGFSSREYVLLHEHSKDDSLDDDVPLNTAVTSASITTTITTT
ncbi:smad nuclear-interacting protein 1 [Halictus rubicundus]|uniref:smad nuclear-interacting protein 1 n=1 Tax=Halictus rubicundus TaxID=77578 RepID=UPI004036034C